MSRRLSPFLSKWIRLVDFEKQIRSINIDVVRVALKTKLKAGNTKKVRFATDRILRCDNF